MGTTTEQLMSQAFQYPDYLAVGIIFAVFAFYGFVRGSKSLSEFALALPITAFAYSFFPYTVGIAEVFIFGGGLLAILWAVKRDTSGLDDNTDLLTIVIAALGATLLLLVIIANTVSVSTLYTFSASFLETFSDATYRFYFVVTGLVAVALSRKV